VNNHGLIEALGLLLLAYLLGAASALSQVAPAATVPF